MNNVQAKCNNNPNSACHAILLPSGEGAVAVFISGVLVAIVKPESA